MTKPSPNHEKKQMHLRIEAATVVRYWPASFVYNAVLPSFSLSHPIVPLASTGGYSLLPSSWSTEARCRTSLTRYGRVLGQAPFQLAALGESAILAGRVGGSSRSPPTGLVFQYSRGTSGGCCSFGIGGAARVSFGASKVHLASHPLYRLHS
jgi:hypothetical protein